MKLGCQWYQAVHVLLTKSALEALVDEFAEVKTCEGHAGIKVVDCPLQRTN